MQTTFSFRRNILAPRRRLATALAAAILVLFAQPGLAATSGTQAKLNDAQTKLHQLEQQLVDERSQFDQLHGQLAGLQSEVVQGQKDYQNLTTQLAQTQTQITQVRDQYRALQTQLNGVVRDAYIQGSSNAIYAVFDARSELELGERLDVLSQMSQRAGDLAEQVSASADALAQKNQETRKLRTQQSQALDQLHASQEQVKQQIAATTTAEAQLESTRNQILDLIVKYRQQLREGDLTQLIDTLQGQGNIVYGDWANVFLKTLSAPTCKNNLVVMVSWQMAEGTSARYNPLATTYDMPGSTQFNYIGVKNYASLKDGLEATKNTLEKGSASYGYGPILKGLNGCSDAMKTAEAIAASSWCGCGSGYTTSLINRVASNYNYYAKL